MLENQRDLYRFPYLDNAIFLPSKIKLVLGMQAWIDSYVTPIGICSKRVDNWDNRLKKIQRRIQRTRREFPANKKELNMETTKPVDLN